MDGMINGTMGADSWCDYASYEGSWCDDGWRHDEDGEMACYEGTNWS